MFLDVPSVTVDKKKTNVTVFDLLDHVTII